MITDKPLPEPVTAITTTTSSATSSACQDLALPEVLESRAQQLIAHLGMGVALKRSIALADLRLSQFHEIYANRDWALRIDKACTAFKRFAGPAILQETVNRFLEGDTEEVVLQKNGEKVTRKVKIDSGLVKTLLGGLDPQFAQTPAGAGGMGGGVHIHITNNLPAATVANFNMGNEDVVSKALRDSDERIKNAKVVDVEEVKPCPTKD